MCIVHESDSKGRIWVERKECCVILSMQQKSVHMNCMRVCVCVRVCLCVWKCVDFIKYAMASETIDIKRKKCQLKDMNDW